MDKQINGSLGNAQCQICLSTSGGTMTLLSERGMHFKEVVLCKACAREVRRELNRFLKASTPRG